MTAITDFLLTLSPQGPELRFLLAAVVVIIAGSRLSRYGDVFSKKLHLGHAFVGIIFMAFATALPELITSASSAIKEDAPNLAFGNNFGSIMFNISILAGLEVLVVGKSIFSRVRSEVVAPGGFSIIIIAVGIVALAVELARPGSTPVVFAVGLGSVLIFACYLGGMWFLKHHEREYQAADEEQVQVHASVSLGWTFAKYGLAVLAIAWAGVNLARAGDQLAVKYSLSRSFVGTIFLAIATSLPEMSATIAAVRHGMYEMAFGNIFGSNAFNIVVLATVDLFYRQGYLFRSAADPKVIGGGQPALVHIITGPLTILMTTIVVLAVVHKPSRKKLRLSWPAVLVLATFLVGAYSSYAVSGSETVKDRQAAPEVPGENGGER